MMSQSNVKTCVVISWSYFLQWQINRPCLKCTHHWHHSLSVSQKTGRAGTWITICGLCFHQSVCGSVTRYCAQGHLAEGQEWGGCSEDWKPSYVHHSSQCCSVCHICVVVAW